MLLIDFINANDVDYSYNRVSEDFIPEIERKLGVKIGFQLREYILKYGYLGYKHIELFGINNHQGLKSDMINKTVLLNGCFEKTKGMVAIEDQGDGDYYLIDEKDHIYRFVEANNEIVPQDVDLFEYILKRFLVAQGG